MLNNKNIYTALDVWENEPKIDSDLLRLVDIGTAHIAGYTYEGKVNGTEMIYKSLCDFLNIKGSWKPELKKVSKPSLSKIIKETKLTYLQKTFKECYNIARDSNLLKSYNTNLPNHFDKLRKDYNLRRELSNYSIDYNLFSQQIKNFLTALRIKEE